MQKINICLFVILFVLFSATAFAQKPPYMVMGMSNSSGALPNFLAQNNFVETPDPTCDCFKYVGPLPGDYLLVGKGKDGVVYEMGWSVLDANGAILPSRVYTKRNENEAGHTFGATYKELATQYSAVFSDKKATTKDYKMNINPGIGWMNFHFVFEDPLTNKDPKLVQIWVDEHGFKGGLDYYIDNEKIKYWESLKVLNLPPGTDPYVLDWIKDEDSRFIKNFKLSVKANTPVQLPIEIGALEPDLAHVATFIVQTGGIKDISNINFKVNKTGSEKVYETFDVERNTRVDIGYARHNLVLNGDYSINYTAELIMNNDCDVEVMYFVGNGFKSGFSHFTEELFKQEIIYADTFAKRYAVWQDKLNVITYSEKKLEPQSRTNVYNYYTVSGKYGLLLKAYGDKPPVFHVSYEQFYTQAEKNAGDFIIDASNPGYRYVNGMHLYEFQIDIVTGGWLSIEMENPSVNSLNATWLIRDTYKKLDIATVSADDRVSVYRDERYKDFIANMPPPEKMKLSVKEAHDSLRLSILGSTHEMKIVFELVKTMDAQMKSAVAQSELLKNVEAMKLHFDLYQHYSWDAEYYAIGAKCMDLYDLIYDRHREMSLLWGSVYAMEKNIRNRDSKGFLDSQISFLTTAPKTLLADQLVEDLFNACE